MPDHPTPLAPDPQDELDRRAIWDDPRALVIEEQRRTAVYPNPHGDLVIRQERDDAFEESDRIIVINARQVDVLLVAIGRLFPDEFAEAEHRLAHHDADEEAEPAPRQRSAAPASSRERRRARNQRYRERRRERLTGDGDTPQDGLFDEQREAAE